MKVIVTRSAICSFLTSGQKITSGKEVPTCLGTLYGEFNLEWDIDQVNVILQDGTVLAEKKELGDIKRVFVL